MFVLALPELDIGYRHYYYRIIVMIRSFSDTCTYINVTMKYK